jgi:nucleoside-diphosphate-sugar epimerase
MKVFVTGATGAIGRFVVPAFVQAGHEVSGLARSDEKAAQLEAQDAKAVRVSLFDEAALKDAFAGHDAVANLATAIPTMSVGATSKAWAENERIRREGSATVVDAALAAGVPRLVQESITFTYPARGSEWIDETVAIDVPAGFDAVAVAEQNTARFTAEGGVGVVLRFGLFYGPGSNHSEMFLKTAKRHIGPVAGAPDSFVSSIHLADAARAVVAALELPAGTYNVVDDEPLTKKDYATAIGAALGKRVWVRMPGRLIRLTGRKSEIMTRSQRVSNAKIRAAGTWVPTYPSAREGWKATVSDA